MTKRFGFLLLLLIGCGSEPSVNITLRGLLCSMVHPTIACTGQSNMSGSNTDAEPLVLHGARIRSLGNDYLFHQPATEPLDTHLPFQVDGVSRDTAAKIGPCRYFADQLLERLPSTSSITVAIGSKFGVPSNTWKPIPAGSTQLTRHTRNLLWGSTHDRVAYAKASGSGEIIQLHAGGEANANSTSSTTTAALWAEDTLDMVVQYRTDWNQSDMPLVYAQLPATPATGYNAANWATVRAEQASIANALNIMVPQTRAGAGVHLTAAENATWGRAAADALVDQAGCP